MAYNGYGHSGDNNLLILYKVINTEADRDDEIYNAFSMPRGSKGPSLAQVKQSCAALYGLNHLGPEGYHWRVCVEDKPVAGAAPSEDKTFSWWDIQDENASLPIKEATPTQLAKFFAPPSSFSSSDTGSSAAATAKGAFKSLGKAVTHVVVGGHDSMDSGPAVAVVAFKLLDLVKMHDDFSSKNHGRGGHIPQAQAPASAHHQPAPREARPAAAPAPPAARPHQGVRASAPPAMQQQQPPPAPTSQPRAVGATPAPPPRPAQAPVPVGNLMDFGPAPSAPQSGRNLYHTNSSPASMEINESRAERLKREYAEKKNTAQRVWDDVDQRWVEVERGTSTASSSSGTSSMMNSASENSKKNVVGISLDPSNAAGKSANVQAAVHKRVNEMRESQAKALQEVRDREAKKKAEDAEEDGVRKKLEPRIKVWSEEHGKKKQLRALLASLHTILWPEAEWKPVSIGDILDDGKMKRCFHKASRVVHPDKTHHLDAEKRFLAKRIFDALSQAKSEYDNGAR